MFELFLQLFMLRVRSVSIQNYNAALVGDPKGHTTPPPSP